MEMINLPEGNVPATMTAYRCSPQGGLVEYDGSENGWREVDSNSFYTDADVRGWAVAIWIEPLPESEPYHPLYARNHAADLAELIALRRENKGLREEINQLIESNHS